MKLLLRNGRVVDPSAGVDEKSDLLIVDGNPLDEIKTMKYVLVTFRDGVPWFDPMGPTVPGIKEVGRAY